MLILEIVTLVAAGLGLFVFALGTQLWGARRAVPYYLVAIALMVVAILGALALRS